MWRVERDWSLSG